MYAGEERRFCSNKKNAIVFERRKEEENHS
jgi:hypothetical protein